MTYLFQNPDFKTLNVAKKVYVWCSAALEKSKIMYLSKGQNISNRLSCANLMYVKFSRMGGLHIAASFCSKIYYYGTISHGLHHRLGDQDWSFFPCRKWQEQKWKMATQCFFKKKKKLVQMPTKPQDYLDYTCKGQFRLNNSYLFLQFIEIATSSRTTTVCWISKTLQGISLKIRKIKPTQSLHFSIYESSEEKRFGLLDTHDKIRNQMLAFLIRSVDC